MFLCYYKCPLGQEKIDKLKAKQDEEYKQKANSNEELKLKLERLK